MYRILDSRFPTNTGERFEHLSAACQRVCELIEEGASPAALTIVKEKSPHFRQDNGRDGDRTPCDPQEL